MAGLTSTATARAGETLDALCWRMLGDTGSVEEVIGLNPRLTSVVLEEGAAVVLPARSPAPRMLETVKLWS